MLQIEDILVDEEILKTQFACDLNKCKGACCTFPGDFGAPVHDEEVGLIEDCLPAAREYLAKRPLKVLEQEGFVEGLPGSYTTVCIDREDCVFVYYEGDIALCALEKAYMDGKTKFRKPISCHLFPIRVRKFGGDYLHYQKIEECKPALKTGRKKGIFLYNTLKEALIRAYGEDWYDVFIKYIENNTK